MGSLSLWHLIVFAALIGLIASALIRADRRRGASHASLVCGRCGSRTNGESETRGNFFIELVLWLCFIIPGLIYSIWRLTTRRDVCHVCSAPELVPIDSPVGKKLLAEQDS